MATMTMLGLYNYDNSLFDNLTFPDGIDKDVAVSEILRRSGEFEVLYSDFLFNKDLIGVWGLKHRRTFEKWVNALSIEYDPLFNYDRTEEYTDTEKTENKGKVETSGSDNNTETLNTKVVTDQDDTTSNDRTVDNKTAAYDATTAQLKTQDITDEDSTYKSDITVSTTGTNKNDNTRSEEINRSDDGSRELTHSAHLFGNIGVTTSQQMLRDEIEVQRFNIYENIADLFIDEFCILIY